MSPNNNPLEEQHDLSQLVDGDEASGGDEYPDQTPKPVEGSPS